MCFEKRGKRASKIDIFGEIQGGHMFHINYEVINLS